MLSTILAARAKKKATLRGERPGREAVRRGQGVGGWRSRRSIRRTKIEDAMDSAYAELTGGVAAPAPALCVTQITAIFTVS